MPPQLPEHALVTLLRQCFAKPMCQVRYRQAVRRASRLHSPLVSSIAQRQGAFRPRNGPANDPQASFSTIECPEAKEHTLFLKALKPTPTSSVSSKSPQSGTQIAVLGGGISGLASAHYLTKELPDAHITIYEGSDSLGGWMKSKTVDVEQGQIVFEQGPRNLRPSSPAALATLEMVKSLGLEDQLLVTPSDSVAARNRFIYYPDHLVKMPAAGQNLYDMFWGLITEPVFKGLLWGALLEFYKPSRPDDLEDESIGSFLTRRFGTSDVPDNVVSAVLHGIYAGDIYKLSVKSLLPAVWNAEGIHGSVAKDALIVARQGHRPMLLKDVQMQELAPNIGEPLLETMRQASVYTFRGGLSTLTNALETSLMANPKVAFRMGQKVNALEHDSESDEVKITTTSHQTTSSNPPSQFTHCISTLAAHTMSSLTPHVPTGSQIPTVTVMVVNLFYPDANLLPEAGFGYLLPRSISIEQNPECALGVVFDSYSSVGQDTAPGTKVTVMLGGHWWDDFGVDDYPMGEQGIDMAKAILKRHLLIEDEPEAVHVSLHRDCIPQYTVGHTQRLAKIHKELMNGFNGRLSVVSNWVDGVGVNDCVRMAREVVGNLNAGLGRLNAFSGLEEFQDPKGRSWVNAKIAMVIDAERREAMLREKMEKGGK